MPPNTARCGVAGYTSRGRRASLSICSTSSRVGARMSARGTPGFRGPCDRLARQMRQDRDQKRRGLPGSGLCTARGIGSAQRVLRGSLPGSACNTGTRDRRWHASPLPEVARSWKRTLPSAGRTLNVVGSQRTWREHATSSCRSVRTRGGRGGRGFTFLRVAVAWTCFAGALLRVPGS